MSATKTTTIDPLQMSFQPLRRTIAVDSRLHEKVSAGLSALAEANDPEEPRVLVRGNELVRMTERGELEAYTVDSLRDTLSRAADFTKGDGPVYKDPPPDVARTILARDSAEYVDVPRVDRVVDVPVVSKDGVLLEHSGHHDEARIYLRPASGLEGVRGDAEMTEDVEYARGVLLDDLLGDFGFADEASRAHALGMLLLPFVRDFVSGPTPLHIILAPDVGSGKTMLAQACLLPGCGLVPATPQTNNEEEWRKRITSALLAGSPAVLLDNLSGTLDSGALASALTTGTWRGRILGESREVTLPVRNVWAATGNNLGLATEQVRRAVPIFLDPGEIRPADRARTAFRHPDLLGWATRERRVLVQAALTLVEHWLRGPYALEGGYMYSRTGGDPRMSGQTLGSFEGWAGVVGGILEAAAVPGFLENRDRLKVEADEETNEAVAFFAAWRAHTNRPLQFKEVMKLCDSGGALHDHLPTALASIHPKDFHRALKGWLGKFRGRRVAGYQLNVKSLGGQGNPRGWEVLHRDAPHDAISPEAI